MSATKPRQPSSRLPPLPEGLPLRTRIQFRATQAATRALKAFGLRETVIRARAAMARLTRSSFERFGSARYSRPALHGIDRKLDAIIARDGGFFVEAGGADGYTQSNSYYLERFRGWRGILVEPMAEMAAEARRNRPHARVFERALVAPEDSGREIELEFGDLFTAVRGLHGEDGEWVQGGLVLGWRDRRVEKVRAQSLSDLLDEAGVSEIDLLSLDVEGYEGPVLRGLDLSRHAPSWILVEMHDLDAGRSTIGGVFGDRYVEHALISPLDVLYKRDDLP